MAAQQVLPGSAYIKLEVDKQPATKWNAPPTLIGGGGPAPVVYTDITDDVRFDQGISWDRGRDAEWEMLNSGSFSATLSNRGRSYDPTTNSWVVGRRPARITCYYPTTATAYVQFVGLIDTFEFDYPEMGTDATVALSGVDWFTSTYTARLVGSFTTSTSIALAYQQMCNLVAIPAAYQSFATTTNVIKKQHMGGTDLQTGLQLLGVAAFQYVFVSRTGIITSAAAAGTGSAVATFGDGGGSELPYTNLRAAVGFQSNAYTGVVVREATTVVNVDHPTWSAQAGTALTADSVTAGATAFTSQADVDKYGKILLEIPCVAMIDYTALAAQWAGIMATPGTYWIREIEIRPMANPATLFPVVLAAELGQKYTIKLRPLGGGAVVTQTSVLRSIHHQVGGSDGWVVTWGFTPK